MIGFYDYTVVLTYISFTSSIIGIFCAVTGHPKWAVFCLALSGLCDMFDGKIARTKKNRTEDEKQFGIQIDSLCDVVCFGVFPIVLCYELGMRRIYSMAILVLYGLAGVIRLGYFMSWRPNGSRRPAKIENTIRDFQSHPCQSYCRCSLWYR